MEYDPFLLVILTLTGLVAGWINTLAGGGSNLTLPMLMLLGLPPDVANGTNRVGVFLQGAVAVRGFHHYGRLDTQSITSILVPTLSGGAIGAVVAAVMPNVALKPLLLGTILTMSFIILVRPGFIAPPEGTPVRKVSESRGAWLGLFVAGVYGGFVQAGVGFILLAALSGGLRYDLVRANALKMVCTLSFTSVSLAVFIWFDQIRWLPGLILAVGTMAGSYLSVKFAIRASQNTVKWFLFAMTLVACAAALFF
ncbi:sulfite exporter TauE/SafE family protein [Pseudohongiella spirulinae]|uniref:Probable membrane transporter protein n=1 Tax=Pseudohongiella spirulinae TaxID=1249552 RepID=A0A0S2KEM5_9GAMM|nr:sulfite exporter TauE/SafE family protein [Pseudohongiella spirulinae]ALO46779.1 Permease [Pseudohongiella spirulinae]